MASAESIEKGGARLAHLMNGMATVYRGLGDFSKASKWYSDGLKIAVKAHGYEHPLTWALMMGSVEMFQKMGNEQKAKSVFFRGVEAIAQKYENELGVSDEPSQSEQTQSYSHERVFPIVQKLLGDKHSSTIGYMNFIGSRMKDEGRYREAFKWYQDAFNAAIEVFGEKNLATLDIAHNVSMACSELGNHKKAIEYLDIALEGSIELLGPDHPRVLSTMSEKAYSLIDGGESEKALELLENVYSVRQEQLGPTHEDTLDTLSAIAEALHELGKHTEALESYGKALTACRKEFGKEFESTLDIQRNMAELLIDMGRNDEAIEILSDVLSIHEMNETKSLYTRSIMGKALSKVGKKEGLEMAQEALVALKINLPDESNFVSSATHNVAECLRLDNQLKEALYYYDQELTIKEHTVGLNGEVTLDTLMDKAEVLVSLKQNKEALEAYQRAQRGYGKSLGIRHPSTLKAAEKCSELEKYMNRRRMLGRSIVVVFLVVILPLIIFLAICLLRIKDWI